jgi:hypothetical protein
MRGPELLPKSLETQAGWRHPRHSGSYHHGVDEWPVASVIESETEIYVSVVKRISVTWN